MANNVFQVKRTSTAGRTPNTTGSYATNSQYIAAGEFALNMTDQILYTSNGAGLIYVGANQVNQSVTGTLTVNAISANGLLGTSSQVLTSNSTGGVYWGAGGGTTYSGYYPVRQTYIANGTQNTFTVTSGYAANNLDVFVNGVKLQQGVEANVQNGSTFTINTGNPANNSIIEVVGTVVNGSATLPGITFTGVINTSAANVAQQTLTYGATTNWNASLGVVATVTLTGATTFANPTNLKVTTYILHIYQDSTGSRTASWGSAFKWPAGVAPVLTTTASAHDMLSFVSDGTYLYGAFVPDVR